MSLGFRTASDDPAQCIERKTSRDGLIEENRESREFCESRATIEIPGARGRSASLDGLASSAKNVIFRQRATFRRCGVDQT
jgi:hypothetical protein